MDIKDISNGITTLKSEADMFFKESSSACDEDSGHIWIDGDEGPNIYWDELPPEIRSLSQTNQENLLRVISLILPTIKSSPVLNESDEKDVGVCVKRMRAALKLRNYTSWNIEVLHDEGVVLGVSPPGQTEDESSSPSNSRKVFFGCIEQLEGIIQLLKISPLSISDGLPVKTLIYLSHIGLTLHLL